MVRSGGGRFRKLSDVCLHNNAIVARGILVTNIALWATRTASAPCIVLDLLEPYYPLIALTSCLRKILESMIDTLLIWCLESNGLIIDFYCGFRSKGVLLIICPCLEMFLSEASIKSNGYICMHY